MGKPIRSLDDIFSDPDAATLLAPDKKPAISYDPEVEGFKEITDWVKQHDGNEPQKTRDLTERKMFSRLKGIRDNPERCQKLKAYDELNLLGENDINKEKEREAKAIKQEKMDFDSLDDILSDDSLLFDDSQEDMELNSKLFDTAKFKQTLSKKQEEEKSVRNKMDGFSKYEPMFKQIQAGISSGQRQLVRFQNPEKNLKEHRFYILNGQLIYIEAIGDLQLRESSDSKSRKDARAHVIYENGTENYPFIRGLASSLYGSRQRHAVPGYIVTEPMSKEYKLTNDDYVTGYVYILKTLSKNPQILEIEKEHDLYKVGVTENTVEERTANAENESTYLYAPIQIVEKIKVINLNAKTLEKTIHHALAEYRLDVDIKAANGKIIHPMEWFVVDLNTIETVVGKLITQLRVKQLDGMQN
ncbi:GIY-YIG nuclease family protein [Lactobacillus delbrueckii]|uniref:GIY-YIG nuclease family protein n=1 Tax=Lactobacillus delbrueckii TaxID=1584 RepID=UPI0006823870|nr:GIY-YIG nuclease family protein [Lactobacillus delbrueckii]APP02336.1 hypothetical protein LI610_01390 [Lactobacillus delbrueckii subsp. indicus]KNE31257.1 hypothetical protein LDI10_01060 [Lactobacillus delbrueckii subsp. indicus]KRL77294.1 hypothetical protein FC09_GL001758 [Lactobacillus delbrueckii subsp. indicus DSM 15996]